MNTFPTLRLGLLHNLRDLKAQFAANSLLFEDSGCPYDIETVLVLRDIMQTTVETVEVERVVYVEKESKDGGVTDEDMGVVEDELRFALAEIRGLNKDLEGVAKKDDETVLKILKAKTTLIEQVVKLRERTMTLRRQTEFEATVIGILEQLVGEDDRAEFLARLKPYRDGDR